jgi:hypothetical protein
MMSAQNSLTGIVAGILQLFEADVKMGSVADVLSIGTVAMALTGSTVRPRAVVTDFRVVSTPGDVFVLESVFVCGFVSAFSMFVSGMFVSGMFVSGMFLSEMLVSGTFVSFMFSSVFVFVIVSFIPVSVSVFMFVIVVVFVFISVISISISIVLVFVIFVMLIS